VRSLAHALHGGVSSNGVRPISQQEAHMDMMALARNWWALAIRGVAAIIFGLLALLLPGVTLAALILLFAAYALVDGIFNLVAALRGHTGERPRWLLTVEGLASIAAGIVAFALPGLTALVLVYVIAVWALITGVLEVVAAIRLRDEIPNEWWLVASGVLSVVFGLLLVIAPGAGVLALVLWVGAYAIVFGALLIGLAFRLRREQPEVRADIARAA
jgi:uncharacterized membrane protein HdeD (DUF308 family)